MDTFWEYTVEVQRELKKISKVRAKSTHDAIKKLGIRVYRGDGIRGPKPRS